MIFFVYCSAAFLEEDAVRLMIANRLIDFPKLFFELQIRPRNF